MTQLIAICKITRKLPGAVSNETIGYDNDGEPIMRVLSESIMPGHIFDEHNEIVLREVLECGAARQPTDQELLLSPKHETVAA